MHEVPHGEAYHRVYIPCNARLECVGSPSGLVAVSVNVSWPSGHSVTTEIPYILIGERIKLVEYPFTIL